MKLEQPKLLGIGLGIALLLTAVAFFLSQQPSVHGEVHIHADFKVYLKGTAMDFSVPKYQTDANNSLSPFVHLHDGDGNVIHVHYADITLGEFFESLQMKLDSSCFESDTRERYCTNTQKKLKLFVNGVFNSEFDHYKIRDLDRILVTYGNESEAQIQAQIASVTDKACIQSGQCPERGVPGDESNCTTGGGCIA